MTKVVSITYVGFPQLNSPRINAMDFDPATNPATGLAHVSVNDGFGSGPNYLGVLDPSTGDVTHVGRTVDGLDALAFTGAAGPDDLDDNDTRETATDLGDVIHTVVPDDLGLGFVSIGGPGDEDWYKVTSWADGAVFKDATLDQSGVRCDEVGRLPEDVGHLFPFTPLPGCTPAGLVSPVVSTPGRGRLPNGWPPSRAL